jgi:hypothetical protein
MHKLPTHILILAAGSLGANLGYGHSLQTIFETDFDAADGASQTAINDPIDMGGTIASGLGYTVTSLTKGSFEGTQSGTSNELYALSSNNTQVPDENEFMGHAPGLFESPDLTTALADDRYAEFTIENPNTFYLREITFSIVQSGYNNASGRETGAYLFSDLTGYNIGDVLGEAVRDTPTTGQAGNGSTSATVDLSGQAALQAITEVTFRVYFTEGYAPEQGAAANRRSGLGLIAVQAIPEPSSAALLLGFGALAMGLSRRRV